ncbi:ABC transporter ATP-binding protein [Streptomyces sp. CA-111067]|uniref:ABC transporter ATP-binding protein n=1 Tax=Streptomyces sp. CA-111067 TaxID=3240046 RepID=UPI003D97936D
MTTLQVAGLTKEFAIRQRRSGKQVLRAVDEVSFTLESGRTLALVGESGSGKSTIARILAKLTRPTAGDFTLDGVPAGTGLGREHRYRAAVQMVFQDPFASLNPAHTVGFHLARPLKLHDRVPDGSSTDEAVAGLLERVNLRPAAQLAGRYPHELSGGQRQRVAIARALAPRPRVLLADEPVSMLDVSVRLEILGLIDRIKHEEDLAVLYITHDLATARHFAQELMVMYRGQVVERGPSDQVIAAPAHPYTRLLADAAPDPRRRLTAADSPSPAGPAAGAERTAKAAAGTERSHCLFAPRCPAVMDICHRQAPPTVQVQPGRQAMCWLHADRTTDAEPESR